MAFLKAAGPTEIYDDGVGYIINLRALEDYGVIIGLGNLHPNFAYNSHYTIAGALYSYDWLLPTPSYDLNGWIVIIGGLAFLQPAARLWRGPWSAADALSLLLPFFFFRNQMSSNSTDLPTCILAWIVTLSWLRQRYDDSFSYKILMFGVLPIFLLTVKITALAFMVFPVALLIHAPAQQRVRTFGWLAIAACCLMLPWFARNVLMTGYLYFLAPGLDVLSVDWKMPATVLAGLKSQVATDIHHAPKALTLIWLKKWWVTGFNGTSRLMIGMAGLGCVLVPLSAVLFSKFRQKLIGYRIGVLAFAIAVGLLFWLSQATEERYGHAVITLAALSWPIGLLTYWLSTNPAKMLVGRVVVGALTLGVGFSALRSVAEFPQGITRLFIFPARYPEVQWQNVPGQNFTAHFPIKFVTPLTDRERFFPGNTATRETFPNCWTTPLPCIYNRERLPLLRQRGLSMRDGFRYTSPPKQ